MPSRFTPTWSCTTRRCWSADLTLLQRAPSRQRLDNTAMQRVLLAIELCMHGARSPLLSCMGHADAE
jgi:hypothetical protein